MPCNKLSVFPCFAHLPLAHSKTQLLFPVVLPQLQIIFLLKRLLVLGKVGNYQRLGFGEEEEVIRAKTKVFLGWKMLIMLVWLKKVHYFNML